MAEEDGSGDNKAPLGLFRESERPPPPTGGGEGSDDPAAAEAARKRFKSTLLGVPAAVGGGNDPRKATLAGHPSAQPPPPPPAADAAADADKKRPSTLVGHPAVPPPASDKPVVAPPKWRGAKAYLEGDVPELRQSGAPPPPTATALQPPPTPADREGIRDSVEKFLQAEDEREGRSSVEAAPVAIVAPDAAQPSQDRPSIEELDVDLLDDAVDAEDAEDAEEGAAPAQAQPVVSAPPPVPSTASSGPAAQPTPAAAPATVISARPPLDHELSARLQPTPLEAAPLDDDGRRAPKLGAAFIGLVLLVGVGGWLVTSGGYQRRDLPVKAPAEEAKPAEAAPEAEAEAKPEGTAEEAAHETEPEAAAEGDAPAQAAPEPPSIGAAAPPPAPAKKARTTTRRKLPPRVEPPPPPPEQTPVITVKPSGQAPAPPAANLPETPSREAVQAALKKVRPRIVECAPGQHGVAEASITVAGSGEVIHAQIGGYYASRPEGSCMARALRGARFPRFQRDKFTVVYPFRF
jgi:hypothetical protein